VTRTEGRNLIQPWLDNELDAARAAELNGLLASDAEFAREVEAQRQFRGFLSRKLAQVAPPEGFRARLQAALDATPETDAPAPPAEKPEHAPRHAQWWAWTVATGLLAASLFFAMRVDRVPDCKFLISCANEHARIVSNAVPEELETNDPQPVSRYVKRVSGLSMPEVPDLHQFGLSVCGAGKVDYSDLGSQAPPGGAFVAYKCSSGASATLMVHAYQGVEPNNINFREYEGEYFWAARHGGNSVVAWISADGSMLCTLVTSHPLEKGFEMARNMRHTLDGNR